MTKAFTAFLVFIIFSIISGCVPTTPTETSSITDDRPVIMFNFENKEPKTPVKVYIDGLYMGDALKFKAGEKGLKIIAGTHIIKVENDNTVIFEEKLYIGRGATKTINLNIK